MFDLSLATLLIFYSGIGMVGLTCCMLGASFYDLKESKNRFKIQQHPYSKQNRQRLLISIVVYIGNKDQPIEDCLKSINRSSYKNYEIIFIDDTLSTISNTTKNRIAKYYAKNPKVAINVLRRRKKSSRIEAMSAGLKKWAKGQLVMYLDADCMIDKHALRNANNHFIYDNMNALLPNHQILTKPTIVSLLQETYQILHASTQKFVSLTGLTNPYGVNGLIYRRILKSGQTPRRHYKFASNVIINTSPENTWVKFISLCYRRKDEGWSNITGINNKKFLLSSKSYRFVIPRLTLVAAFQMLIIITPVVVSYLLYLALYFKQSSLFGLSWIIFSVVTIGIIWSKSYLSFRKRLRQTFFIPIMYSLFYIISILQAAILIVIAVKNAKLILFRKRQIFSRQAKFMAQ